MYNKQSIKIKNNVGSTNMYFIRDNICPLSIFKANVFGYVLNTKMCKASEDVQYLCTMYNIVTINYYNYIL